MILAPRWRKALRDVGERPLRMALAVFAMAAGIFGVSLVLTSFSILGRELARTYGDTHPASAILNVDPVTAGLADSVRQLPGVAEAEARPVLRGRMRVGPDEWAPMVLYVVPAFEDQRLDRFTHETGSWPPAPGEILLERSALSVARARVGDEVVLRSGDSESRARVAGTVHAPGLPPAWMEHAVVGFVGWNSRLRTGTSLETPQLRIRVAERPLDETHIRGVAERVQAALEQSGHFVGRIDVPPPGRHPHADQMDTFLYLLGAFGVLTFLLGVMLVASTIHSLLIEEVRQVGVMKALGGTTAQISSIYLAEVLILAAVALVVALPLGTLSGQGYARFSAEILNATIGSATVPAWVLAAQAALALVVPLAVAAWPLYRATRISVREALQVGDPHPAFGTRALERRLAALPAIPRPLALSLRTALRQRGRLVLTVGTLAAGGAVFLSALNVAGAWNRALDADRRSRRYDVFVILDRPYAIAALDSLWATLPGIARAEYWPAVTTTVAGGKPTRLDLTAPDPGSELLALRMLRGRWLIPADSSAVVVNQALARTHPEIDVGRELRLGAGDRATVLHVVGVAQEMSPMPAAYGAPAAVRALAADPPGTTRTIRLVGRAHDPRSEQALSAALERAFDRRHVPVFFLERLEERRRAFANHLLIVLTALFLAASLVVLVGGLGLASALALDVVRRTREIGILSAIGAAPRTIAGLVRAEGLVMGFASWIVAAVLAIPVTVVLQAVTGRLFLRAPLDFYLSAPGLALWLVLALCISALASAVPARRAARLTVREALSYA